MAQLWWHSNKALFNAALGRSLQKKTRFPTEKKTCCFKPAIVTCFPGCSKNANNFNHLQSILHMLTTQDMQNFRLFYMINHDIEPYILYIYIYTAFNNPVMSVSFKLLQHDNMVVIPETSTSQL